MRSNILVLEDTSLGYLYSQHQLWLRGWLQKKLGCPQHAADLTQDTFVRLLLKKVEVRQLSTPRIYLTHIAKGLVIDLWRKQSLEREYLDALVALDAEEAMQSLELQAIVIETLCQIDRMLNQLAPKVREAFLLAQIDGLTYLQISNHLGVSERMIKKYMATAMLHCLQYKQAHKDI